MTRASVLAFPLSPTQEQIAAAAGDMARILEREPELGDFGFGVFGPRRKTPAERAAELAQNREWMMAPRSLVQFLAARAWLRRFAKTKGINRRAGSSYGLKHVAEYTIGYLTNGVFIAAAIAEDFQVHRIGAGPNAWFNISATAWRRPAQQPQKTKARPRLVVNNEGSDRP